MRLGVSLNDERCYVAALPDTGTVHAHLTLQDDEHGKRRRLKVFGFRHTAEEATGLEWPSVEARVGDTLQLAIMTEGPGDPPREQAEKKRLPTVRMVESEGLADKLRQLCETFGASLSSLLIEAESSEPPEQVEYLRDAIESVCRDVEITLHDPVLLGHPGLSNPGSQGKQ